MFKEDAFVGIVSKYWGLNKRPRPDLAPRGLSTNGPKIYHLYYLLGGILIGRSEEMGEFKNCPFFRVD